MTDFPAATPRENAHDIVSTLKSEKLVRMFSEGSKGAWVNEKKAIEKKVPHKHKHLLNTMTTKGREIDGGYATRTAMLFLTSDLEPGTPNFETAKDVMTELIKIYKPEVILWRLQDMDPAEYEKMTAEKLAEGLANKSMALPKEFEDVDVLADFDDYELVGDKNQKDRTQTPLQPIVDQIIGAIGKQAEKSKIEVVVPEPAPANVVDRATLTPTFDETLREKMRVQREQIDLERKKIASERKVEIKNEKKPINVRMLEDSIIELGVNENDAQTFMKEFSKALNGTGNIDKLLDIFAKDQVFVRILTSSNSKPLIALCQSVVEASQLDITQNKKNKSPSVALKLLEEMSYPPLSGFRIERDNQSLVLSSAIDMALLFDTRPKDKIPGLAGFKKVATRFGYPTEEKRFNSDKLVDGFLSLALEDSNQTSDRTRGITDDCLAVLNSPDSRDTQYFLARLADAYGGVDEGSFFNKLRIRLNQFDYEIIRKDLNSPLQLRRKQASAIPVPPPPVEEGMPAEPTPSVLREINETKKSPKERFAQAQRLKREATVKADGSFGRYNEDAVQAVADETLKMLGFDNLKNMLAFTPYKDLNDSLQSVSRISINIIDLPVDNASKLQRKEMIEGFEVALREFKKALTAHDIGSPMELNDFDTFSAKLYKELGVDLPVARESVNEPATIKIKEVPQYSEAVDALHRAMEESENAPKTAYAWLHEYGPGAKVEGKLVIDELIKTHNPQLNMDNNPIFKGAFDIQFRRIAEEMFTSIKPEDTQKLINLRERLAYALVYQGSNDKELIKSSTFNLGNFLFAIVKDEFAHSRFDPITEANKFIKDYMQRVGEIDKSNMELEAQQRKISRRRKTLPL